MMVNKQRINKSVLYNLWNFFGGFDLVIFLYDCSQTELDYKSFVLQCFLDVVSTNITNCREATPKKTKKLVYLLLHKYL